MNGRIRDYGVAAMIIPWELNLPISAREAGVIRGRPRWPVKTHADTRGVGRVLTGAKWIIVYTRLRRAQICIGVAAGPGPPLSPPPAGSWGPRVAPLRTFGINCAHCVRAVPPRVYLFRCRAPVALWRKISEGYTRECAATCRHLEPSMHWAFL